MCLHEVWEKSKKSLYICLFPSCTVSTKSTSCDLWSCFCHQNREPVNCFVESFTAALCCSTLTLLVFNGPSSPGGFIVISLKCWIKTGLQFHFSLHNATVGPTKAFCPEPWNDAWATSQTASPKVTVFPSFCSVELISFMGFSVYVYRRLKGLFVFPLVALWLVSPQTCLKHCYLWPDAFFTESYWIMSTCRPPSFKCKL